MIRPIKSAALRLPEPGAARAFLFMALRLALLAALTFAVSRAGLLSVLALSLFAAASARPALAAAALAGCAAAAMIDLSPALPLGCAAILVARLGYSGFVSMTTRLVNTACQADTTRQADTARPGLAALRDRAARMRARSPNDDALCAALAGIGALVPGLALAGGRLWPSALALFSSLAALSAAPFLRSALEARPDNRFPLPEERAGLFLLACASAAGVYRLWPPAALAAASAGAGLLAPWGGTLGAGFGAAVLMVSGDAGPAAALALCGAAAQMTARAPRFLNAAAVSITALAASAGAGLSPGAAAALCAAPPLVALLPGKLHHYLRKRCRPAGGWECDPNRLAALLRSRSAERLRAMSAAFGDLAEGYLTPAAMPDEQALMGELRDRLCDGCPDYAGCWAGDANRGARVLCALVTSAVEGRAEDLMEEGAPPELSRQCRRARQMPERVGEALRDFARRRGAEFKRGAENRLISAQFLQARQLIDALAAEQARPVRLRDRQARQAAAVLERSGIGIADAMLVSGARTELMLTLREGGWTAELARAASARLGRAFGRVYAPEGPGGGPTLRFIRKPRLRAEAGAVSLSRDPEDPSGDSHLIAMLDDDRLLALICDGMGSGAAAARESAQAARLLGRFLAAGAEWPLAVETVNAMLINASAEDMFSTVDMLLLDLSGGAAEFVKLAACPALIVRDGDVESVEGGRLPLGILEQVRPAASRATLLPGDIVVMFSDGVADAADPQALREAITLPWDDMNALAERVVALATEAAGERRDDMTAVCVRIERNDAA